MPSTPETRGLANAEFFAAMKSGAFFANGGRGDLVVTDDLVAALESGHLAGAAVDVTDPEPLPATSPLWDAPNMLITPHVSGWFHLAATLNNVVDIAAENLRHLQAGETLRCWIEHYCSGVLPPPASPPFGHCRSISKARPEGQRLFVSRHLGSTCGLFKFADRYSTRGVKRYLSVVR